MSGYETIELEPLTVALGALVVGADLRHPVSEEQAQEIRDALMRHCVLFFRDQELTDSQQLAFAARFGPVNETEYGGTTHSDPVVEWLEDTSDSPPKTDLWHTDLAFREKPPDFAILNMRAIPPVGGDTLWLSLYAAYEGLSPMLRDMIDGLTFEAHRARVDSVQADGLGSRVVYRPDLFDEGSIQPLVRVHPVTGRKALFMCGQFLHRIVGLHPDESEALIRLLRHRLDDPNIQCRWHWRENDLVIWDERCTNHRAVSDHYPNYRLARRCTAGASMPVGPGGRFRANEP
jgi:taurine dioxygenase